MLVPILIVLAAAGGAGYAAWRLLPRLEPSRVGNLAFYVVVVLLAIGAALVALEAYSTIRTLTQVDHPDIGGVDKTSVVTDGLIALLRDAALPFGLAAAVYLLAPGEEPADAPGP